VEAILISGVSVFDRDLHFGQPSHIWHRQDQLMIDTEIVEPIEDFVWKIRFHEYSPGLLTSILMVMNAYFLVRYRPGLIRTEEVTVAIAVGALGTAFLSFYIPLLKGRPRRL
jgi:hypothetical protein